MPKLSQHLFAEPECNAFAVLDGAAIPELLAKLHELNPEHVCLYRGELQPDLAECAPYLVRLQQDSEFTNWSLGEGWGKHWGIFAISSADMIVVRKHFRTFLMVKNPEGKQVYFRYYDPRVLRTFLPTCNPEETASIFGPLKSYLCEADKPETLLSFGIVDGLPRCEAARLVPQ